MLRSRFDNLAIGFPVTVMTPNTEVKYLTQEQIDKVCEGVGSFKLNTTERSFRYR